MRKMLKLGAVAVACAGFIAGPAAAATDVSINTAPYVFQSYNAAGTLIANNLAPSGVDGVTNNDVSYWTATTTFNLASANDTLTISNLASDDRTVLMLNGVAVAATGIYAPGVGGTFIFAPGGSQVPWTFTAAGAQSDVLSPFLVGTNTLQLIVNNTNNGIYGGFSQGPSSLYFTGSVMANLSAVPEPATWAMMLLGFGGIGMTMRRRRRALAQLA